MSFLSRYKYDANDNLVSLNVLQVSPFARLGLSDSYPCRIWCSISDVKENIQKSMNDAQQYQGLRKNISFKLSLESWYYFMLQFQACNPIYVEYPRTETEKGKHCDLSLSSRSTRIILKLLRIDCEESMACARDLFGTTFGIGIRNRPPKKGEEMCSMHHGDIVNIVNVRENGEMVIAQWLKEVSYAQGVDFIYNEKKRVLKVRI